MKLRKPTVRPIIHQPSTINQYVPPLGNLLLVGLLTLASAHSAPAFQLASVDSGVELPLFDIAYGNNTYVAVGNQSVVSTNGTNWQPLNYSGWLRGIIYAQDKFVAVGQEIVTSTNGVDWQNTPPIGTGLSKIAYADGTFVSTGGNKIFTSTNGNDWVNTFYDPRFFIDCLASSPFGFSVGGMVTEGMGQIRGAGFGFSTNGYNWTAGGGLFLLGPLSLAYGNNIFVGVGQDRVAISSPDGQVWNIFNSELFNSSAIEFVNGRFIVMRRDGNILLLKSTNSWDAVYAGTNELYAATHDSKDYYFVGSKGTILKSVGPTALASVAIQPGPTNTFNIQITGNPGFTYYLQQSFFLPNFGDTQHTVTLETTTTNILFPSSVGSDGVFFRLREQ